LARQDGMRPDGLTLIPWQRSKSLTWDVTVVHTLADSYVSVTARSGGAAAEQAAGRKTAKYDPLHFSVPTDRSRDTWPVE